MASARCERFILYQLAEQHADLIWNILLSGPTLANETLKTEPIRPADGIAANIAEGTGNPSYQDNRRFILIAHVSFSETRNWLRRTLAHKLLCNEEIQQIQPLVDTLHTKLNAGLKSIGRQLANPPQSNLVAPLPSAT